MAKIVRYNGDLKAFASAAPGTERTIFGSVTQSNDLTSQVTASFLRGWGIVGPSDQPSLEDFNGAMYTHGQLLAYLHQVGIAEYNASQEYHLGSVTVLGGIIYISLANTNVNNNPSTSPTFWRSPTSGRILRRSTYRINGSTLQVSVDGAPFVTAATTFTPIAGAVNAMVEAVGGGGGGGGCFGTGSGQIAAASGGGAGGYSASWLTISALSGVTLSVGPGGSSAANSAGAAGSTTSVGALLSATGGSGGTAGAALAVPTGTLLAGGAVGGIGTNGNIVNAQGGHGNYGALAASPISGAGGSSLLGAGGMFVSGTSNGVAATSYGGGGGGSSLLANIAGGASGGAGAGGMIRITEYS